MKKFIVLVMLASVFSCNKDMEEITPEPATPIIVAELSYNLDNGETFTTSEPTMEYSANQATTFLKYTDDQIKVRINFKGNTTGVYTGENGIFSLYSYDQNGNQSIDMVCDTFTGIVVTVDTYGEVGEMIEGSFTAENCDGQSNATTASGSFSVIRIE